jgi:sialate O-acetylesterase
MRNVGVTITAAPDDWQIIQRDKNNCGAFAVEGCWKTAETQFEIQIRLVNENDGSPVSHQLDWQDAEIDLAKQTFSVELKNIPTGGLYRLETRITRPYAEDTRPLRGDYRHHLGIGDVYVITGQSNASGTGLGQAGDPPRLGVHLFGNNEQWKLATHPLEDATDTLHPITITSIFHGHSPWLAFAGKIQRECNIPIGLIPCALGGSSICQWVKDDGQPAVLFDNMLDMINRATGGTIAGILWHQGESDCMDAKKLELYPERFKKLLELFRANFGSVNIFTGQLNCYINPDPELGCMWSEMREIQRQFARQYNHVHLTVSAGLPLSDVIHNSAAANVILGQRFADTALQHRYGKEIIATFPEPEIIVFTSEQRDQIKLNFCNLSGNWVTNNFITDFTVEDENGFIPELTTSINPDNSIDISFSRPATGKTIVHAFYGNRSAVTLFDDSNHSLTPFSQECKTQ